MDASSNEEPVGEVISLDLHRRERTRARAEGGPARPRRAPQGPSADRSPAPVTRTPEPPLRATVLFDLASPATYLAAERADRLLPGARWRPVHGDLLLPPRRGRRPARERAHLEARAAALRLPLVWPDRPVQARLALRVAALADERGRGPAFVQAAARLAWCGGYDLEDLEVLAEAAEAAGLSAGEAVAAAHDASRDAAMVDEAGRLRVLGISELPVVRLGERLVAGEERLAEAAAVARRAAAVARPLPRAT
jgi:2-hydroxychromene-2-carboxylate isomerase